MKSIGGYFEFELQQGEHFHKDALRLNTARNCLEYILRAKKYDKVYIPYYTCEVVLEPFAKLDIQYEFYSIDWNLAPIFEKTLSSKEAFLYTNYFGLKQNTVETLSKKYHNLIVDNSQAFFAKPLKGVDTFYSARKFFGVSDGAYLYTDCFLTDELEQDHSYERMTHLLKRMDVSPEFGYDDFKKNDDSLKDQPIRKMSSLTRSILASINYNDILEKRRENYLHLHNELKYKNKFSFDIESTKDVPMVYPYFSESDALKKKLISQHIYIATYWPNVFEWRKEKDIEYQIADKTIFLPIDQRYREEEMSNVIVSIYSNN